jgi:uncharacterized membrane protein YphA (DoxX/SURF4 family)
MFGSLGYPAAAGMAVLAGLAETGGLPFALGLLTPLAREPHRAGRAA